MFALFRQGHHTLYSAESTKIHAVKTASNKNEEWKRSKTNSIVALADKRADYVDTVAAMRALSLTMSVVVRYAWLNTVHIVRQTVRL